MKKVYTKDFDNRKQMWKYFNKVKENKQIETCWNCYNCEKRMWEIGWIYR